MPRKYTRKTDMGLVPHERMLDAVKAVVAGTKSIRKAANDGDYEVEFLRRGRKNNTTFVRPATEDIASVAKQNIRAVLPNPLRGTTQRTKGVFSFPVDFGKLDLR